MNQMRPLLILTVLLIFCGTGRAEEARGNVDKPAENITVKLPNGLVHIPAKGILESRVRNPGISLEEEKETVSIEALTFGKISAEYELVQNGEDITTRNVHVFIKNRVLLPKNSPESLRQHEEMHKHINNTGAKEIQTELESFKTASSKHENLQSAEDDLISLFNKHIRRIDRLHQDWDANDIIP